MKNPGRAQTLKQSQLTQIQGGFKRKDKVMEHTVDSGEVTLPDDLQSIIDMMQD